MSDRVLSEGRKPIEIENRERVIHRHRINAVEIAIAIDDDEPA